MLPIKIVSFVGLCILYTSITPSPVGLAEVLMIMSVSTFKLKLIYTF